MKSREIKPPAILWVGETALAMYNHVDPHVRDQYQHEFLLYEDSDHDEQLDCTTLKNKDDTVITYEKKHLKTKIEDYINAQTHKKYTLFIGSNFELLVTVFLERIMETNKPSKTYKSSENYQEFMHFNVLNPFNTNDIRNPNFKLVTPFFSRWMLYSKIITRK